MDFAFPINLSLRDALITLVALLALYVIVAFLRIRRLRRLKAVETQMSAMAAQSAVAAYSAVQEPELRTEPESARPDREKREPEPLAAPSDAAFPWNEPPGETALQRQVALLESEVAQLRKEVGGLRAEVLMLREEQQRVMDVAAELPEAEVVEEPVEVASNVSPLYNEAMQFALQGLDAAAISQSCGISRAEAELVVALVRNREI
jgi:hypothetical protein